MRSVYSMSRRELEAKVLATVRKGLVLRRRRWVGSLETDAIIGSSWPTHRRGV